MSILFEEFVRQDVNSYMGDGCGARDNCYPAHENEQPENE